jgi:hypothetical protein
MPKKGKVIAYSDPNHPGNSSKYRTGEKCITPGCNNQAGTWWSKLLCFECNVKRIDRISSQLDDVMSEKG